jgi:hypothetical protein
VQNGKFAAWAFALDKQLNKVDFPTLGNPTIPHLNAILLFYFRIVKVMLPSGSGKYNTVFYSSVKSSY